MRKSGTHVWNHDGVSETVGYIILFGIMTTGIALVTLYGYPLLLQEQANANVRNMERNMIVLQNDFKSLTFKSVPYRETTLQVTGGVLSIKRPDTSLSFFKVSDSSGPLLNIAIFPPDGRFPPGTLEFLSDSGEISIALQNGAVVKYQTGGSVMLSEPRWFIDTSGGSTTMIMNLIQVNSSNVLGKSGISTVQMTVEPMALGPGGITTIDRVPDGQEVQVSITYTDKYPKSWENYFENVLGMSKIIGSNPPTWKKTGLNRVIIKAYRINIINL